MEWLYKLCNQVWKSKEVPEDWINGAVECIPKKDNRTERDSWREMTILSIPGKVYCQVILNCMRDLVDTEPREH